MANEIVSADDLCSSCGHRAGLHIAQLYASDPVINFAGVCTHRSHNPSTHDDTECKCRRFVKKADVMLTPAPFEAIVHPPHYGGADNVYEVIKVIEAWNLSFCLGNTVKYISRAGKKDPTKTIEDLKKARWYLDRQISNLEKKP